MNIASKLADELPKKTSSISGIFWNYELDFKNKNSSLWHESLSFLRTKIWDFVTEKIKNSQILTDFKVGFI